MKTTTFLVTLGIISIFAVSALGQRTLDPAKMSVNGIKLGSTNAQLLTAFGKPTLDGPTEASECAGGESKNVEFEGAVFGLANGDSKDGKTFEVVSFDITSPKYVVSGIRVGDDQKTVLAKLGRKYEVEKDPEGATVWWYKFKAVAGSTSISFKNGKVIAIGSAWQIC